jgi:malate dehydrogenase (oxaloacetate-decarboxylating)(NADP+)
MPSLAKQVRDDLIMATGRSDFPNQVNNALCFPYIFKGALDVRATCINEAMKLAAVHAIKDLVKESVPAAVLAASHQSELTFGPEYLLPKLIDPRLKEKVSSAVSVAAIKSGVARLELVTKKESFV